MLRNVIQNYINRWEKSCESTTSQKSEQIKNKCHSENNLFSLCAPFFVVVNYIQRNLLIDDTRELVLVLQSGPISVLKYAHLSGKWSTLPIFIGSIVGFDLNTKWVYCDDEQNFYHDSCSCVIGDDDNGPILFPHLLIKLSSISSFKSCPRAVFFKEISSYKEPTYNNIFGLMASKMFQEYIVKQHKGDEPNASEIATEIFRKELLNIYFAGKQDLPFLSSSIKNINELNNQISKLADYIDEPHGVLMTIPNSDTFIKTSKAFPGLGCDEVIANQSFYSFLRGMKGCLNCVVEIKDDGGKKHYVPVEVVGTVRDSTIGSNIKNGHLLSLTAQTQFLKDKFNEDECNHAFVFFIGSKERFWIKPRNEEKQHLTILRNKIAESIYRNEAPEVKAIDQRDCTYCQSNIICALYKRMHDKKQYVKRLNSVLPKSLCDFTTNSSRTFFNHFQENLHQTSLSTMWCSFNISALTIEQREEKRCAIRNLQIQKIKTKNDIHSKTSFIYNIKLVTRYPGMFYMINCNMHDTALITKDGKMPIIGIGTVIKIKDNSISIKTFSENFHIGDIITIDFCRADQMNCYDNAALTNILSRFSYSTLNSVLIDEDKPMFSNVHKKFEMFGLNSQQIEVVDCALRTTNYLLVNAPHGTGRISTVLRIIQAKAKEEGTILVAPYYYRTINKICEGLESLKIPYIVSGKLRKINEKFHKNHETTILSQSNTLQDIEAIQNSTKVYIINSSMKSFDIFLNTKFTMIILLESSSLSILRSIPSLWSAPPFILFGDLILDDGIESIFSYMNSIGHHAIKYLWKVYDCEPAIVRLSRIIWGSELKCSINIHAEVDLSALKVLNHKIRPFFKDILSMNKQVVFIDTNTFSSAIMISIAASIIFEKVNLISTKELLVKLCSILFKCRTDGNLIFTKFVHFFEKCASRISAYYFEAIKSHRRDVTIAVTDSFNSSILKNALGFTKRKLIFVGNLNIVSQSPLWR